ncbi:COL8A [Mytilus edulis]|uniref:COL8A n=1 Tax=Mytilus edulis TaxID=6550 RepID=A0A8S3SIW3_MYTED|nr:COL8A [Mytilus edulis]
MTLESVQPSSTQKREQDDYSVSLTDREYLRKQIHFTLLDVRRQNLSSICFQNSNKQLVAFKRELMVLLGEQSIESRGGGNVAFSSYMTEASANAQSASVTTGSTIKFDRTEANYGNGYSTSTGKFRAPSTGVYGFSWTLCVDSRTSDGGEWKYGEYGTQLMSGSSVIGLLHADTETKGDDACSTGFVIKYVSKDTEVYLRNIYDHTGKIFSKMNQTRTTFSGWKLYQ